MQITTWLPDRHGCPGLALMVLASIWLPEAQASSIQILANTRGSIYYDEVVTYVRSFQDSGDLIFHGVQPWLAGLMDEAGHWADVSREDRVALADAFHSRGNSILAAVGGRDYDLTYLYFTPKLFARVICELYARSMAVDGIIFDIQAELNITGGIAGFLAWYLETADVCERLYDVPIAISLKPQYIKELMQLDSLPYDYKEISLRDLILKKAQRPSFINSSVPWYTEPRDAFQKTPLGSSRSLILRRAIGGPADHYYWNMSIHSTSAKSFPDQPRLKLQQLASLRTRYGYGDPSQASEIPPSPGLESQALFRPGDLPFFRRLFSFPDSAQDGTAEAPLRRMDNPKGFRQLPDHWMTEGLSTQEGSNSFSSSGSSDHATTALSSSDLPPGLRTIYINWQAEPLQPINYTMVMQGTHSLAYSWAQLGNLTASAPWIQKLRTAQRPGIRLWMPLIWPGDPPPNEGIATAAGFVVGNDRRRWPDPEKLATWLENLGKTDAGGVMRAGGLVLGSSPNIYNFGALEELRNLWIPRFAKNWL